MRTWTVDASGRWSGGGSAVLNNFEWLSQSADGLRISETGSDLAKVDRVLVVRNIIRPALFLRTGTIGLLPQNALAWWKPSTGRPIRRKSLRRLSDLAMYRADLLIRIGHSIPGHTVIIPNVLDTQFDEIASSLDRGRGHHRSVEPWIVLGALHPYKGLANIIEGFRLYRMRGGGSRLDIAGPVAMAGYERTLRHLTADLLSVRVVAMALAREEAVTRLAAASGVIFPSHVEASPVTVLEALAVNGNVACSDIPGHRDIVRAVGLEEEVVWFSQEDSSSLVQALNVLDDCRVRETSLSAYATRAGLRESWAQEVCTRLGL